MWKKRAQQYGVRAVLNIGHPEEEVDAVTKMQKEQIFPILKSALTGEEKSILDFGCGPGRFTTDLAELIQGNAIGIDPIQHFLDIAARHQRVEYRLMKRGQLPIADESVDFICICLVLGGVIKNRDSSKVISEIDRVLKRGGLIILVENTSDVEDGQYWKYRSVESYRSFFSFAELEHCSDYFDLNETISTIVGRKHV